MFFWLWFLLIVVSLRVPPAWLVSLCSVFMLLPRGRRRGYAAVFSSATDGRGRRVSLAFATALGMFPRICFGMKLVHSPVRPVPVPCVGELFRLDCIWFLLIFFQRYHL